MRSAIPTTRSELPVSPCALIAEAMPVNEIDPRRAVHERRAEQQHGRAERADDEVLEPGFERAFDVVVDRAHDVERDREPLEREEEHHEVPGADEERHAGGRGEEEREELRDVVVVASHVLPRDERHRETDAAEDDLRERSPAVAVEGARDDRLAVRRVDVEPDRGDEAAEEAELGDDPAERPPVPGRNEHRAEERDERSSEQHEDRREREPVDVRRLDVMAGSSPRRTSSASAAWATGRRTSGG